jgi:hypothetical protein
MCRDSDNQSPEDGRKADIKNIRYIKCISGKEPYPAESCCDDSPIVKTGTFFSFAIFVSMGGPR